MKVIGEVTDLWGNREFAYRLKVPDQKKKEIQQTFSTIEDQREQLIIYWMEWDPRASWRGMIITLDGLNKTKLADTIRVYAEPILGELYIYMTIVCPKKCPLLLEAYYSCMATNL